MLGRLGIAKAFEDFIAGVFGNEKPFEPGMYEVNASEGSAVLYRGSSYRSPVVTRVVNGEQVYVFNKLEDGDEAWCRIEYSDISVWIEAKNLKPAEDTTE